MPDKTEDAGVIATLVARLNQYRLPRLLELDERVKRGELVTDNDMEFLERVLRDAREIQPLIERNPHAQPLYAQVTALYAGIIDKAEANEVKSKT